LQPVNLRFAIRSTLQIDDDLLEAARHLAMRQNHTCGEVVSDLLRKALMNEVTAAQRNGIALFPKRSELRHSKAVN